MLLACASLAAALVFKNYESFSDVSVLPVAVLSAQRIHC